MSDKPPGTIDPRLRSELEKESASPGAGLPVIVVYRVPPAGGGRRGLSELERRQRPVVERLRARLAELGVTGAVHELSLANGLAVRLTPAQVRELARHAEVEKLLLDQENQVTL